MGALGRKRHTGARTGRSARRLVGAVAVALVALTAAPWGTGAVTANVRLQNGNQDDRGNELLFFAADGLVQTRIEQYAAERRTDVPGFRELLHKGARAGDGGLLTQAPPNTGAGWYTLATGAWPSVHGSTNNTFHINGGTSFGNTSTSAFGANVLQAETLAQAAERDGKRVAQIEWAGGRSGSIDGPTVDFRNFRSGRGVATNYISPTDDAAFTASFGLQFDHPAGFAGRAPFPAAAPALATGWTDVPRSYSPPQEMRLRVLDGTTDKYGLNAYIFDSRNDRQTRYDQVLFSTTKDGDDAVGVLREGEWADVKVTLQTTDALNGLTGGFLVKVERLASDLSQVRLFHTSVTRAIASWPNWEGEDGYGPTEFEDFVAEQFPSSQAGDFAVLEAGIVSEETYIEQGMYWSELYHPLIEYILDTYQPDIALVGFPVTDEVQHQFLGLVSPTLPNGARNPAYDDVQVNGTPDGRVEEREEFIREAYEEADRTMRLAQQKMGTKDLTTFVSSDHGFAPQFAAIDASLVLKNLGLLSTVQTANCRLAAGETIGRAKACWAGGALQIYLNLAGRDPAPAAPQSQVPANQEATTVAAIRAAFQGLVDPNDWTGDGNPEGWKVIDRTFTKAEARAIPNGPGSTADMANPTRTGDLVVFAYPPYQFDAATPNTLIARSAFFGQHGYVPDVQVLDANINMRATFLAGGEGIRRTTVAGVRSIDLAATAAFIADIPVPQQSQGRVVTDILKGRDRYDVVNLIGLNDFHGQLDPTTTTRDGFTNIPVGGAAALATMFDQEAAALPGDIALVAAGDNVGASPPNSALLADIPAIDVENLWGMDATSYGNHEFDFGVERILQHLERAEFPFLSTNIVEEATGEPPEWLDRSTVLEVNGVRVGVIGATVRTTPELVRPDATAGLEFLDEAEAIEQESERLRRQGVRVQVVVIHEGATLGANRIGAAAAVPWDGPIVGIVEELQDTTIDLVIAGHTHRIANTVIGRIPVAEGVNAGGSYSVAQLIVHGRDVIWAGAATRVATSLGVPQRADVKAVVDAANTATAPLRNRVIGSQTANIVRDPTRLNESAMGNFVADAMLERYDGDPHQVEAAITNSGGLRQDLLVTPPSSGGEAPGEITWGEAFAVLPFGNATVIETLTYDQLIAALTNGFSPVCNPNIATGRFPQVAGLRITFTCNGTVPGTITVTKSGAPAPMGSGDTVRIVTNDFMFGGGDGYTALMGGTDVAQTGELLLDVVIEDITASSPVSPPPLGRITRG